MKINDMNFFHQATRKICGSLDINTVLNQCQEFLKNFIPLDGIILNIYDSDTQSIVCIAATESWQFNPRTVPLPREASQYVEENAGENVEIVNQPGKHMVARYAWKAMEDIDMSFLVLKLIMDDEVLGVVVCLARDFDRYTTEDARRLDLLHDPFAIALSNTLQHQELLRLKDKLADDNQYLNRQLHHLSGDEIVGINYGLKNVMEMVRQIAPLKSQVMLQGETGVGKEIIANAIHFSSRRALEPFIKVNCGAIPENLIDTELFGHEKGAFTGALTQKRGRFERAHKGTLFLDEIGELPLSAQIRLLRVLQNKEIERVGGSDPIPVDIRIITATHRDLPEMIKQGKFREDLWYRLNVFPITIPPLRQRKSDIPALTLYFLEKKAREMNFRKQPVLAPGALEKLQAYDWPGNVRELENMVERTLIQSMTTGPGNPIRFGQLYPEPVVRKVSATPEPDGESLLLDEVMKVHIEKALGIANGKVQGKSGAAALLGLHPNTLRNRMKKLKIAYGRMKKYE